ncbi:sulfurtransferase [Sanguibacter antarcticus]|uniref:Thiosulfate/3-mercaptopyruvate sulfurtransferase n=1 Tax=Sanguibacter antarcticus TaxID=372484 RepID=A0A2A9E547_9MICO|nr:sulfurtransferase [Sanguibacter antarcticus]PFG33973.1 thiosulfate/3-mercaptopyruvate sulfurtransferase [Sanguibacter antarcticus]
MNDRLADLSERRSRVFVGPAGLRGILDSGRPVTILDVRWALGRDDGREQYLGAHVPGAVYVDLETELSGPATAATGRHPLPSVESLQDSARSWGVRSRVPVVVYDAIGGLSAARAWWLLRWGGHDDVRILDGGLAAWVAGGGTTESRDVVVAEGDITVRAGQLPVLDADAAADLARTGVLLDARAAERYRGDVEPIDPRAGHIPGALSAPTVASLGPDGRLVDAAELLEAFAGHGITDADAAPAQPGAAPRIGTYCGSGVTASHEVAVLASLGIDASLYPGSWSQWANDPGRPAASGSEPGGLT